MSNQFPQSCGELYFETVFKYERFPKFVQEYTIGYYRVDFAWIKKKIYFEVDGEQHFTNEAKEYDRRRALYLSKLGWKCIKRIRWSQFKELSFQQRKAIVKALKKKIIAG